MRKFADYKYSGAATDAVTERELRNRAVARRAAADGMVLLKNEGILPFSANARLALFGSGARYTIKGGTGSGDVNERAAVNIDQGLRNAGFSIVSGDWLDDYDERYTAARESWRAMIWGDGSEEAQRMLFENYVTNPFIMPDGRTLCAEDVKSADAAVYVVSRNAGEGADRKLIGGDYYLTEKERSDLGFLNDEGVATVLLVNSGGPVELTDVSAWQNIKAILYVAQAGQEGGNAVADILSGRVTPSGKLTATWARCYEDYPSAKSFSYLSGNLAKEYYTEGIYVGYRYFDTFGVKPLYGFGYGLSYTSFAISEIKVSSLTVTATVTNTGDRLGRETVQVYASCPQSKLPKENRRLIGFAKTRVLEPGARETVSVDIRTKDLASFDEEHSDWIVEAGRYGLWVGNSLDTSELSAVLAVKNDTVIEQTTHICPLQENLDELARPEAQRLDYSGLPEVAFAPAKEILPVHVQDETDLLAKELANKLPAKELIPLLMGEISKGQGTLGAAGIRVPGSAGETSSAFKESLGLASAVMADGPAGVRLTKQYEVDLEKNKVYDPGFLANIERGLFAQPEEHEGALKIYQHCTAFPVGVLLAQSFDKDLLEEVGRAVADELHEFHIAWWLAPGMNIQRNPLCGRNFEYYSEDPLLSGVMAAAITRGVQSRPGAGTTIKHFICNNLEDNRIGSDSIVSERALREIYLRGFEIAVKESHPMCIMTSYNLINGVHGANCHDTCTVVARGEWGFRGIIMSDWTTTLPEAGSIPHLCVKAGNDLIMPGMVSDLEEIQSALENGDLAEDEIRICAERMINSILRTNAYMIEES